MSATYGLQSLGAREKQEDAFRIVPPDATAPDPDLLLLLADGMGGHVGGEIAAELVLEAFEHHCIAVSQTPRPRQRMAEAMEAANTALRRRVSTEPALAGMGATLLSAIKLGNRLSWLSVGDSPLYLWRAGSLRRLNADHSVHGELMELVAAGQMSQAEADGHPKRNALRSALAGEPVALVDSNAIALEPGDIVLLASDGLQTLSDSRIAAVLQATEGHPLDAIAAALLEGVGAEQRPRQDNATVLLLRYQPASDQPVTLARALFPEAEPKPKPGRTAAVWAIGCLLLMVVLAAGWFLWHRSGAASSGGAAQDGPKAAATPTTQPVTNAPKPAAAPKATPPDPKAGRAGGASGAGAADPAAKPAAAAPPKPATAIQDGG